MKNIAGYFLSAFLLFAPLQVVAGEGAGSPDIFKAAQVAMSDFDGHLKGLRSKGGKWKYADYVTDVKNYAIGVSEGEAVFVVVFVRKKIKGVNLTGGGAKYLVDKNTLKVIDVVGYK